MSRQRRLTTKQLASEPDIQLRENIRPLLSSAFKQLQAAVDRGDLKAIKLVTEIVNLTKGAGGVTIFNQQMVANNGPAEMARAKSFERIIGQFEEKEQVRGYLAQPEVADVDDIAEGETEEVPAVA